MYDLNETHDPDLTSWVDSANEPGTDFPIQNLPFCVFRPAGSSDACRGGVAIGERIVDLAALARTGLYGGPARDALAACSASTLNPFMALGPRAWSTLRLALSRSLRAGSPDADTLAPCLVPRHAAELALPAAIGDYTDFYTSIHHATRVGRQLRPDNPLLPNYQWVPVGYHGRSSSIGIAGQSFHRPRGQIRDSGNPQPSLEPSRRMDFELEVGVFIGPGNDAGQPIAIDDAESHVFGLCLLNDWSARDIQAWEYQPLGPFLAKNFATTISPWIVTLEALAPYRLPCIRPADQPQPLPYLESTTNAESGAFDLHLAALIETQAMRHNIEPPARLSRTNFLHAYWTVAQMVTHHTVNGCNLRPGDLFGSGTQSGPGPNEAGCLLELTDGGRQPVELPGGETRRFLDDGDRIILRGRCEHPSAATIGFGEAVGTLLPALDPT